LTHYEGKLQKRIIDTGGLAKKTASRTASRLLLSARSMAK